MITNSCYGKHSPFVTWISISFVVSDVALAIATCMFKTFEDHVLNSEWHAADMWAYPFNVFMSIFVIAISVPHWIFFYTYFECCITMPYFYMRRKVPTWLRGLLTGFNVVVILA